MRKPHGTEWHGGRVSLQSIMGEGRKGESVGGDGETGLDYTRAIRTYASVVMWIGISSGLIFFNKYILDTLQFNFPLCLTMVRKRGREREYSDDVRRVLGLDRLCVHLCVYVRLPVYSMNGLSAEWNLGAH